MDVTVEVVGTAPVAACPGNTFPDIDLGFLIINYPYLRCGQGICIGDLIEEIQLHIRRELEQVTVLSQAGKLPKGKLQADDTHSENRSIVIA